MTKKSHCYFLTIVLLAMAAQVSAAPFDLVAQWNFDDGTANDSSGNGYHGTMMGGALVISDPVRGMVLSLSGDPNDYVDCGNAGAFDLSGGPYSFMAWFKVNKWDKDNYTPIITKGSAYRITQYSSLDYLRHYTYYHGSMLAYHDNVKDGQWHHAAAVYDGTNAYLYVDGLMDSSLTSTGAYTSSNNLRVGSIDSPYEYRSFNGLIDDVRVYSEALSQGDILQIAERHITHSPNVANGAGNVSLDVVLNWTAGDLASATGGQDVYFGTHYKKVLYRWPEMHIGLQDDTSYDPGGLEYGTTYYWAVDAVNSSHGDSPWPGEVWSFRTETEGYYKDLFIDGGIWLSSKALPPSEIPASKYLGLSMEYLLLPYSTAGEIDYTTQNRVFVGNVNDDNGLLLYPDGEPRFRLIYLNGGSSTNHGASLGEDGRDRIRNFYYAGGSYTGSCAGAFIVSVGRNGAPVKPEYLHIWPALTHTSGLSGSQTGMFIPGGSPLLDYYGFGGDNYIAEVRHNGGCYVIEGDSTYWTPDSEVLLNYDKPGWTMHNKVSTWAQKRDAYSGRLVPIGSHPESALSSYPSTIESIVWGEQRDLLAGMFRYALDGNGVPNIKAALQNGVARYMDDNFIPNHEKIGDRQYHHFTVEIPAGMSQLTITLDGDDVHDLNLFARQGDFAFKGAPDVLASANSSSSDEILIINNPNPGVWYIGVKGVETVSTTVESWGLDYAGDLELLNGVGYSITAEWDAPRGDLMVNGVVNLPDLKVLFDHWLENTFSERPIGELMGHWKLDEPSSTLAFDSSGKDHIGRVYNGALWQYSGGQFDGALSFDEIDDYVKIEDFDYTNTQHEFSLCFWFKIDDVTGSGYQYMFSHGNYSVNNSLNVYLRESGIDTNPEHVSTSLELDDGTELWSVTPAALADGSWHMYALTVSATEGAVIYIDANPVDTRNEFKAGWFNPGTDIYLAARSNMDPARHYGYPSADDGLLDDVRLYSFALTADDIATVYTGSAVTDPEPELICSVYTVGDLNEDGKVNLLDYVIMAANWFK
ncbi:LamG-like jellyroll fold domain-containing protein [Planctomycetota bacterium]